MAEPSPNLIALARRAGIATSYRDTWGQEQHTSEASLVAVLGAMGFATDTQAAIEEVLESLEAESWRALLPPVTVLREDGARRVVVTLPERLNAGRVVWSLAREDGARIEGETPTQSLPVIATKGEGEHRHLRLALDLPRLPLGYHRLFLAAGHENAETDVIVTPVHGYLPPELENGRAWGLTAQLHSIRSALNWGMGDYGDLRSLAALAAGRGAAAVGINPLHALFPAEPRHISPYSPSTRLFLNPLYLDVIGVPEFASSHAAQQHVGSPDFVAALAGARAAPTIDYPAVMALKAPVLRMLHAEFSLQHLAPNGGAKTARGAAFRRFQRDGGASLAAYGTFNALHAAMLVRGLFAWPDWPEGFADARSEATAAFAKAHESDVEFHHYLEWEGERQLAAASPDLPAGLYRDLAVGVDPNGADAWAEPSLFAKGATVGAPPDLLNLKGQDWGLAPLDPLALRRHCYKPFIAALRANMRHAGVLRVDHAMVLKQLYWVPRGAGPAEGAYVAYPFEELLGLLALESRRNRCAVIGEDLGTVPPGFSAILNEAGVLSCRLMLFERDAGGFRPPRAYPRAAAAGFSTHDIATLRGFWLGTDLGWRRRLNLYPSPAAAEDEANQRRVERRQLLDALLSERLLTDDDARLLLPREDAPHFATVLAEAVHRFLGRSRAALALVQAEDALGEEEQANLPGTIDEHPNWRRKLALPLEAWGHDGAFVRVVEALDRARRERVP
jgi:4-alpha-glucanotransferase